MDGCSLVANWKLGRVRLVSCVGLSFLPHRPDSLRGRFTVSPTLLPIAAILHEYPSSMHVTPSIATAVASGGRVLSTILGWTSTMFANDFFTSGLVLIVHQQSLVYLLLPPSYTELSQAQVGEEDAVDRSDVSLRPRYRISRQRGRFELRLCLPECSRLPSLLGKTDTAATIWSGLA